MKRLLNVWKRHFRKSLPRNDNYPETVILEVTNACNLRCWMCHFHSEHAKRTRKIGFMPRKIWKKVIDELAQAPHSINLYTFGAGEPLLHPELFEIIRYAKSKHNIKVGFLSNGMLLNSNARRQIFEYNLDWIGFSLDGDDPNLFEKFRKGSNYKQIEGNITSFLKEKKYQGVNYPYVKLNMVLYPELKGKENSFIKKWIDLVDEISISVFRPIGVRDYVEVKKKRHYCPLLDKMMVISWDGKVALCCEDIFVDVCLGSVLEETIPEIWQGKKFMKARNLHKKGKWYKLSPCRDCLTWANELIEVEEKDNLRIERWLLATIYKRC